MQLSTCYLLYSETLVVLQTSTVDLFLIKKTVTVPFGVFLQTNKVMFTVNASHQNASCISLRSNVLNAFHSS